MAAPSHGSVGRQGMSASECGFISQAPHHRADTEPCPQFTFTSWTQVSCISFVVCSPFTMGWARPAGLPSHPVSPSQQQTLCSAGRREGAGFSDGRTRPPGKGVCVLARSSTGCNPGAPLSYPSQSEWQLAAPPHPQPLELTPRVRSGQATSNTDGRCKETRRPTPTSLAAWSDRGNGQPLGSQGSVGKAQPRNCFQPWSHLGSLSWCALPTCKALELNSPNFLGHLNIQEPLQVTVT